MSHLLVHSKDPLVRETAAQVLGQRGSLQTVSLLVQRMAKDDNLWVRARCAEALGSMGASNAIRDLRSALAREKDQRVRRMIGMALVRLGQRTGIEELMWQLKSGTNYTRAEVMTFLVQLFGQPLGQDADAWWAYLAVDGNRLLAHRPPGAWAIKGLTGLNRRPLQLLGRPLSRSWQQVPAVVLRLSPTREPITVEHLQQLQRSSGSVPDGCLLLVQTDWRDAPPQAAPPSTPGKPKPPAPPTGPGLTLDAVKHLLQQAPHLLGLGIDTPTLDAPGVTGRPGAELLLSQKRFVIPGVDGMDQLPAHGLRMLILDHGPARRAGERRIALLAIMP